MTNFKDELRQITYEPAKLLVEKLEENYDELTLEQKMDLERLKFGLKMFDLEKEIQKQQRNQWKKTL